MSTMRGFGFREHGGLDRLEKVENPEPEATDDSVRIRVSAAAFNRLDRFTLEGIRGVAIERPHVLGSDAAGIVDAVGPAVTDLAPGTPVLVDPGIGDGSCEYCQRGERSLCRNFRILGEHTQGSATDFVVVPRRNVHPQPDRLSPVEAAAAPLVFETTWRALSTIAGVRPGERVAIVGAGGGTATAAVQVAKLHGGTGAVVSRSREKAERARSLSADDALSFDAARPLDRVLWEWSEKRGVDVIFDSVGAPTIGRSVQALARGGRVVVIGATAGSSAEVNLSTVFWRQASIRGSTMSNEAEFRTVLGHLKAGRLTPVVDSVYPVERAVEAFHRFESPEVFGKVVVYMTGRANRGPAESAS